jgi:hypothetical protein
LFSYQASLEKISPACRGISLKPRIAPFKFQKRRQRFFRMHNESFPLSRCASATKIAQAEGIISAWVVDDFS